MENKAKIRTNVIQYALDPTKLSLAYELYFIRLVKDAKPQFYHWLARFKGLALTPVKRSVKYLVLFPRGTRLTSLTGIEFTRVQFNQMGKFFDESGDRFYRTHVAQLLLNQMSNDPVVQPQANLTSQLFISQSDWKHYDAFREWKQRYALKAQFNWEGDLQLNVVTFTEDKVRKPGTALYYWDAKRNWMCRSLDHQEAMLYQMGNGTKEKNLVNFLSFKELNTYEQSKVGVIDGLLKSMNKHHADLLQPGGEFQLEAFPIIQDFRIKLQAKVIAWEKLANQVVHVYYDETQNFTEELAHRLVKGCQQSDQLAALNIRFVLSDQAEPGLNIQVLRDARDNPAVIEAYESGNQSQIIQHLTVENFGKLRGSQGREQVKWTTNDIFKDNAMVKIVQELSIKADLRKRNLASISTALVKVTSQYRFFRFECLDQQKHKSDYPQIMVTRLISNAYGEITLDRTLVDLQRAAPTDELTTVCLEVAGELRNGAKYSSVWANVDCVVQRDNRRVMITQTPRQLMPIIDELGERVASGDPSQVLEKATIRQALQRLLTLRQAQLKQAPKQATLFKNLEEDQPQLDGYSERVRRIQDVMEKEFPIVLTVEKCYQKLAKSGVSLSDKLGKMVNRDLERECGFAFHRTTRQTEPYSLFNGFRKIGLLKIKGKFHYFVGSPQPLKEDFVRAIRFRELRVLQEDDQVIFEFFPDLVAMMMVEFVRNGQCTVTPYVVKYLKEYWKREKRLGTLTTQDEL